MAEIFGESFYSKQILYRKQITKLPNKDDQEKEQANSIHPEASPISSTFAGFHQRERAGDYNSCYRTGRVSLHVALSHKHRNINRGPDNRLPGGDKVLIANNLPQHQKRNIFKKLKSTTNMKPFKQSFFNELFSDKFIHPPTSLSLRIE